MSSCTKRCSFLFKSGLLHQSDDKSRECKRAALLQQNVSLLPVCVDAVGEHIHSFWPDRIWSVWAKLGSARAAEPYKLPSWWAEGAEMRAHRYGQCSVCTLALGVERTARCCGKLLHLLLKENDSNLTSLSLTKYQTNILWFLLMISHWTNFISF